MSFGRFTNTSHWLHDRDAVIEPCDYCASHGIYCQVAEQGEQKGSCTSCTELSKTCSLDNSVQSTRVQLEDLAALNASDDDNDDASLPGSTGSAPSGMAESLTRASLPIGNNAETAGTEPSKLRARFSREALQTLKAWLSANSRHPYPNDEEKESLARKTGLKKAQIATWMANARRRGLHRAPSASSSQLHTKGLDIPGRSAPAIAPATGEMNPMERWAHSPPDQEPASPAAIARAISSSTISTRQPNPLARQKRADDGSARSVGHQSSTGSSGTGHSSSSSFGAAMSCQSRDSSESFTLLRNRGKRRRRRWTARVLSPTSLRPPVRAFQCTFCTETFKTKYDWQRHEKSLHLSLERWICAPEGPAQFCAESACSACVYCGERSPSPEHAKQHNHYGCAERTAGERTFYRKDHLRQHLSIIHNVKFQSWSMEAWKSTSSDIRSRCGFCGQLLDSWTIRVDHLAKHFKNGKSMADWSGDWGFEEDVLHIVQNGIPPYLIHDERNSLNPYLPSVEETRPRKSLEDQVKLWLLDYINNQLISGTAPTDDEILTEAQRIVRKADVEDSSAKGLDTSWFRDLIMLSEIPRSTTVELNHLTKSETTANKEWIVQIESISGKGAADREPGRIGCSMENALMEYVRSMQAFGLAPVDSELQVQACKIIDDIEPKANFKCQPAVGWFKFLIYSSAAWLSEFRRRAGLSSPNSNSTVARDASSSIDDKLGYASTPNSSDARQDLKDWLHSQQALGKPVPDEEMQSQARLPTYGNDEPWNPAFFDDPSVLDPFKRKDSLEPLREGLPSVLLEGDKPGFNHQSTWERNSAVDFSRGLHWDLSDHVMGLGFPLASHNQKLVTSLEKFPDALPQGQPVPDTNSRKPLRYFLSDANCYGRLEKELTRFVMSCMSPNNPLQHIPSDAEIQNQARWIIYDDDDPWNQTAADNSEWLIRFKRQSGIIPEEDGPGLAPPCIPRPWKVTDGGTGFHPPFVNPKPAKQIVFPLEVTVFVDHRTYTVSKETAEGYLRGLYEGRHQPPASIFCSRELEHGLNAYVQECAGALRVPTDDELRAKAREILGMERTAADDSILLEGFKAQHALWSKKSNDSNQVTQDQLASGGNQLGHTNDSSTTMVYNHVDFPTSAQEWMDDFTGANGSIEGLPAFADLTMPIDFHSEMDALLPGGLPDA